MAGPVPPPDGGSAHGRVTRRALLLLVVLSPGIAEVLTASAPITTLAFDPVFFLLQVAGLLAFYGGGVLLVREARVRWHKGWPSVFLLGAAYGIVEEGLAVHTFFQPSGAPVHLLGSFGRFLGVNWVWAVGLTLFHALFSIALPILLVDLRFPELRARSFLSDHGLLTVGAAYVGVGGLFALTTPHAPPITLGVATLLAALALVAVARAMPRWTPPGRLRAPSARALVLAGVPFFSLWLFYLLGGIPNLVKSPAVAVVLMLGSAGLTTGFAYYRLGRAPTDESIFWLGVGALLPLLAWSVVVGFIVPGTWAVSALLVLFLHRLRRHLAVPRPPRLARAPIGGGSPGVG